MFGDESEVLTDDKERKEDDAGTKNTGGELL
jgi:hypothetical protein